MHFAGGGSSGCFAVSSLPAPRWAALPARALKARYLELFASNIVDFPSAVLEAHNLLVR